MPRPLKAESGSGLKVTISCYMGQCLLSKEYQNRLPFKSRTQAFFWCSWKSQGWAMKYKFIHNKQTYKKIVSSCTFSLQSYLTSQSGEWAHPMWHEKSLRTPHPLFHMCKGVWARDQFAYWEWTKEMLEVVKVRLRTAHSWYTVCLPRQQYTQVWQYL